MQPCNESKILKGLPCLSICVSKIQFWLLILVIRLFQFTNFSKTTQQYFLHSEDQVWEISSTRKRLSRILQVYQTFASQR